ncbi:hypothetical protein [Alphaentomopoxvirus acuprea]|uniref:Uncharacterized protein n=1 Tax=Alphaentomopoxvirus acuprea TaxID=62099 RepID=W6JKU5_9POXV|nr:hypothetical protein BA82_gp050 [Anomala cuprea entomopoxvirus]BAO49410.1 hypothetical protein [Anomala cuprea entomopoxvirus]
MTIKRIIILTLLMTISTAQNTSQCDYSKNIIDISNKLITISDKIIPTDYNLIFKDISDNIKKLYNYSALIDISNNLDSISNKISSIDYSIILGNISENIKDIYVKNNITTEEVMINKYSNYLFLIISLSSLIICICFIFYTTLLINYIYKSKKNKIERATMNML